MVADWEFGIQDENLQKVVDEARAKGAQVVVVLRHNGMDVDLKMASRVRGIDAIFGGHTHDGVPVATGGQQAGGTTLVTNAGSNGKFLGVMDFDVQGGKVADYRYRLLPVFANLLPADPEMDALITKIRAPYESQAGREAGRHRRPAVPPRQLQRQLGPAAAGRADGRAGRRDRLLAGLPLGHHAAAGRRDHARADDGQDGHHLLVRHRHDDERRDDQDHARGRRRQPVQPRPVLPAGRRHGARGRPAVHLRPEATMGQRISDMRLDGKPIEAAQDLQGGRLGAGGRRRRKAPANKPVWDVVEDLAARPRARSRRASPTCPGSPACSPTPATSRRPDRDTPAPACTGARRYHGAA